MTVTLRSDKLPSRMVFLSALRVTPTMRRAGIELRFPFRVLKVGEHLDDIVPRTGLAEGDFARSLQFDGLASAVPVAVAEVADGTYEASFTPNEVGDWSLRVVPADIEEQCLALEAALSTGAPFLEALAIVTYDEAQATMSIEAWGVRNGRPVLAEALVLARVDLFDHEGNPLFTVQSSAPGPNGHFVLEHELVSLDPDNPYGMTITIMPTCAEAIETAHVLSVG